MLQAIWGRRGKQQQEQSSLNHVQSFFGLCTSISILLETTETTWAPLGMELDFPPSLSPEFPIRSMDQSMHGKVKSLHSKTIQEGWSLPKGDDKQVSYQITFADIFVYASWGLTIWLANRKVHYMRVVSYLLCLNSHAVREVQSPKKVFLYGWENAVGKLRQKRKATAGKKITKPRTKTFFRLCR